MNADEVERGLKDFIRGRSGARGVAIENLVRLSGGASRETWSFDADLDRGDHVERIEGIFRADPAKGWPTSPGRALEYFTIKAAWDNGVVVPEPLWNGDDDLFGVKFFVMRRVPGETLGARFVRGEQYAHAREVMPGQLAASLARIHRVDASKYPELSGLPTPAPGVSPAKMELDNYESVYRFQSRNPHPVFDLALRWLRQNMPPAADPVFVHGDFRMGNVIFGEDGLRGVIDWELAHFGDPMEDVAWVMMRSWRFGGPKPVAGVGDAERFFEAYESEGGYTVDRDRLKFWQVFASIKWGIITVTQAERYLSGQSKSVELAAIGRRTAETELELLDLLAGREF